MDIYKERDKHTKNTIRQTNKQANILKFRQTNLQTEELEQTIRNRGLHFTFYAKL